MVLSNKKLKQKLRAELLAKSVSGSDTNGGRNDPDSQSQSLRGLLDSVTHKPRLSKREKRRKIVPLEGPEGLRKRLEGKRKKVDEKEEVEVDGVGGKSEKDEEKGNEGALEGDDGERKKMKKKKKRKREEGEEDEAVKERNMSEMKKKNTKKKTKKKKKVKNGSEEQCVEEMAMDNDSQVTKDIATKVYVGGIPYSYTEDDIRCYFEVCGTITRVDCMTFPDSGKFRGIAILTFETEAAAKRALAYDRAEMGGLQLTIQPYKSLRANKSSGSSFAPKMVDGYNRIYVGNLSWNITEDDLRKVFSDCDVQAIQFGTDKETGDFRGYAHVDLADDVSVAMALRLDQEYVCGRPVKISCAVPLRGVKRHSKSLPANKEAENSVPSTGTVSGKIRRRTCYECGEKGHLSSDCPKKQTVDPTNSITT